MAEETANQNTPVSTEPPATKSEVQDDVKWLEERLDKQDLTLTEIRQELAALKVTKTESPELFTQKTLEVLQKIESTLNQRVNRKAPQSMQTVKDTQSNLPASQTVTTNQDAPKEQGQTQDKNVGQDKSVLRFRRKAI